MFKINMLQVINRLICSIMFVYRASCHSMITGRQVTADESDCSFLLFDITKIHSCLISFASKNIVPENERQNWFTQDKDDYIHTNYIRFLKDDTIEKIFILPAFPCSFGPKYPCTAKV